MRPPEVLELRVFKGEGVRDIGAGSFFALQDCLLCYGILSPQAHAC